GGVRGEGGGAHHRAFRRVTTSARRRAGERGPRCPPVVTRLTLTVVIRGVERVMSRMGHGAARASTRPKPSTRAPRDAFEMTCITDRQAVTVLSRPMNPPDNASP